MSTLLESYKKPRPLRLPPYFYILLITALLVIPRPILQLPTTFQVIESSTQETLPETVKHLLSQNTTESALPQCGHIVLVSAARHGSTWLIDSAEGCKSNNGSYGTMNRYAELWNDGQTGPLTSIQPDEAAEYALRNHSIKIFPPALNNHAEGLEQFFGQVVDRGIPVFVLRRRLEDSFDSLEVAKETRTWNTHKDVVEDFGERKIVKDQKWELYYRRMEEYFVHVMEVMKRKEVSWDFVRYEDAIGHRRIVGVTSGCYIRNCNFRRR